MIVLKYLLAIVVLSVVIIIHELGHFIVAKASGVVVEEFSIGMGPKLLKFKKGDTLYCIKPFLFGGSCKMKGMIGEEDEDINTEGSFLAASKPRKFAIILAGPLFNFLLAFVLSVVLIGIAGYDPCIVYKVNEDSTVSAEGLQEGDQIVNINGMSTDFYGDYSLFTYGYRGEEITLTYVHENETHTITYTPKHVTEPVYQMGVYLDADRALIAQVIEGTPAYEAGLQEGDVVLSIDGTSVTTSSEITPLVRACDGNAITLVVQRDGVEKEISFVPKKVEQDYYDYGFYLSGERIKTSPIETIGLGFKNVGYWIRSVFYSFKYLFTGRVSANDVAGPVGIVSAIGNVVEESAQDGGLYVFLNLVNWIVMISANLGVMNLLPIPALDGGRLLFILIEIIRGKPISKEKEGIITVVGFALLLVIMAIVLFNDIRKLFTGGI